MKDKKIKLALIGLGNQGKKHLDSLLTIHEKSGLEIVGVCDVANSLNNSALTFFDNYQELYKKTHPDIVIISTPNYLHKKFTIDALTSGMNVIKEKPLAVSYEDAQEMINVAHSEGKILATMQQRYYSPLYLEAKSLIPFLGNPLEFSYRFTLDDKIETWRWDIKKAGGGSWLNMGWHGISIIQWLLGDISKINLYWKKGGKRTWEYETDHSSYAEVLVKDTVKGSLFLSCAYPKEELLKISFSDGILYLSRKELHIFSKTSEIHITDKSTEKDLYIWQLQHLTQQVITGKYNMQNDLKIMKIIQQGIDSTIEGNGLSTPEQKELRIYN